ncbi:GNAT family N-acetyltransferase [Alkalimonas mucilaginosa]|uniref:BioF2-like acetyltransferase domain-containing protein n=1 Tax=Alkalimonas mucilaginosa TaxID=3057676 RepID=A0ABU7JBC7_9GAMM|nr:GNAT family N-acetyltransferase [Alkalimonas sp. MEB004]MEE2022897.1 hypothetical protein [Alkalimonas sp. MEB004]
MKTRLQQLLNSWKLFKAMPVVTISLQLAATDNTHAFYRSITEQFFKDANRRHRKFPLFKSMVHGVAMCDISKGFEHYLSSIESSARRNYKKALRNGFTSRPIDYNQHLDEIWAIRRSTPVRQGELPDSFLNTPPKKRTDPASTSPTHDYRYFGVFDKEGKLVAYAGCFIAGELMMIEHIYGHHEFQPYGVVPMLLIAMARHAEEEHPAVRYYAYGTFFGASQSMQRFKKKFCFYPHKVSWQL